MPEKFMLLINGSEGYVLLKKRTRIFDIYSCCTRSCLFVPLNDTSLSTIIKCTSINFRMGMHVAKIQRNVSKPMVSPHSEREKRS